jgi:hypothetical protein
MVRNLPSVAFERLIRQHQDIFLLISSYASCLSPQTLRLLFFAPGTPITYIVRGGECLSALKVLLSRYLERLQELR